MSGHAGFLAIANRPMPINGGMRVDGVNAPDKASSGAVVVPGGGVPEQEPQVVNQPTARKFTQQLDILLAKAAKDSTRLVDMKAIEAAARLRLDAAIAHADKLAAENRVVSKEDMEKRDVQNLLLSRELHGVESSVKSVNGYKLPSNGDIVRRAKRQVRSIFVRDIIGSVAKKGWFV